MSNQEEIIQSSETFKWKGSALIQPLYLIGLISVTIAIASLIYFNISSEKKIAELEKLASVDTLQPLVYDRFITERIISPIYDTVTVDTLRFIYTIEGTERKGDWFLINPKNTIASTLKGGGTLSILDTLFLTNKEVAMIDSIILNRNTHRTTKGLP